MIWGLIYWNLEVNMVNLSDSPMNIAIIRLPSACCELLDKSDEFDNGAGGKKVQN